MDPAVLQRLRDDRGNQVLFVSHCLLDENVRYLGGAFHAGAAPEMLPVIQSGVGVCQMPCPEARAWGGVDKRWLLRAYGLGDSPLYRLRRPLFRLFRLHTRLSYWRIARSVADDIERYRDAGVRVSGVVGIGASPSCGVRTTLDMGRSFEALAGCPLAEMNRATINDRAVVACRVRGEGMFTRSLRRRLERRGIRIRYLEHDLIAEMHGAVNRWPEEV